MQLQGADREGGVEGWFSKLQFPQRNLSTSDLHTRLISHGLVRYGPSVSRGQGHVRLWGREVLTWAAVGGKNKHSFTSLTSF